jgi:Spy/CpxP family protein refolding chaperone
MQINRTLLTGSLIALGLLAQPVLALAFEGDSSPRSPHECGRSALASGSHRRGCLADRLGLSKAQRGSLNTIDDKYRPELRDLRELRSDNRKALARMDASDARLQELAEAQGKAIADMIVLRKSMRADVDRVLTDEQRQQLREMFEHPRHRVYRRNAIGNDSTQWKPAAVRSLAT